jgi:hypothetical protein
MVRLQLRASVSSQGYQIRMRIKIRDFEAQEFASLAASPSPDLSQMARKADSYPAQRGRDSQSMQRRHIRGSRDPVALDHHTGDLNINLS